MLDEALDVEGHVAPEMPGENDTTTDIVARAPIAVPVLPTIGDDEMRRLWRLGSALAASGMFKDARQAEQAFAKILIGRDLGLSPAQSMTGIHIVEGKPELAAVTLASFVQRHERGYDYRVIEHSDTACKIEFRREGEVLGVSEFTMKDAEKAGLNKPTRSGAPSNYTKFPRNMLYARAMSNGVKWYCPEVTGGIPVYYEGEIEREPTHLVNGGAPQAALEEGTEPDWGEDPEIASRLIALFERANEMREGAFLPAKVRMLLRGKDDDGRVALIAELEKWIVEKGGELPAVESEVTDAEEIEPNDGDPLPGAETDGPDTL